MFKFKGFNCSGKLAKCYVWSAALYDAETRTLRKEDEKHLRCGFGEQWKGWPNVMCGALLYICLLYTSIKVINYKFRLLFVTYKTYENCFAIALHYCLLFYDALET